MLLAPPAAARRLHRNPHSGKDHAAPSRAPQPIEIFVVVRRAQILRRRHPSRFRSRRDRPAVRAKTQAGARRDRRPRNHLAAERRKRMLSLSAHDEIYPWEEAMKSGTHRTVAIRSSEHYRKPRLAPLQHRRHRKRCDILRERGAETDHRRPRRHHFVHAMFEEIPRRRAHPLRRLYYLIRHSPAREKVPVTFVALLRWFAQRWYAKNPIAQTDGPPSIRYPLVVIDVDPRMRGPLGEKRCRIDEKTVRRNVEARAPQHPREHPDLDRRRIHRRPRHRNQAYSRLPCHLRHSTGKRLAHPRLRARKRIEHIPPYKRSILGRNHVRQRILEKSAQRPRDPPAHYRRLKDVPRKGLAPEMHQPVPHECRLHQRAHRQRRAGPRRCDPGRLIVDHRLGTPSLHDLMHIKEAVDAFMDDGLSDEFDRHLVAFDIRDERSPDELRVRSRRTSRRIARVVLHHDDLVEPRGERRRRPRRAPYPVERAPNLLKGPIDFIAPVGGTGMRQREFAARKIHLPRPRTPEIQRHHRFNPRPFDPPASGKKSDISERRPRLLREFLSAALARGFGLQ